MGNRGGKRPNAGRKKNGKERLTIYLDKECAEFLRNGATNAALSISEFAEKVIIKGRMKS